jgi:hypothetical protein
MPCLNPKFPYLITYNPNNPRLEMIEGSTGISARKNENFDYWYCQFSCHNSFRLFDILDLIPVDILDRIRSKEVYVVLDNGLEPFLKSADGIYHNIVLSGKIPASQIIFMSSVPIMHEYIKNLAEKFNQDRINVEWWSMFEYQLWDVIQHQITTPIDTLSIKEYKKKYINFNRRWRLHRPVLLTLLHDRNLIDHGYISFGKSDFDQDTWSNKWAEMHRYYSESPTMLEIFKRNIKIKELPLMYLDTDDLITNRAEQTRSTDVYYLDTYFSVVNETTFHTKQGYDGVPFLSEKIFKCIAMKHPFVMVSVPNSLQYLKKLGYKTFEGIIDESYDTIIKDDERMFAIIKEVQRLCNLKDQELHTFLIEARQICNYNYCILKNKTEFITRH